jgi:hypothetical protein
MSVELKTIDSISGEVLLTRYFGGIERGACLQVTPPGGTHYLSMTKEQALDLAVALIEFANGKREKAE